MAALTQQQLSILNGASRLLKPGGRLVYATCSVLRQENEDVAAAFEAAQAGLKAQWQRLDAATLLDAGLCSEGNLRLWPHRHGCDGFFAAVWQKA